MDITDSSVINNEKLHQCHSQSLEHVAPPAVTHARWGWPLGCINPKQEPNISNNNNDNDNNSFHQPDALRNVAGWYKLIGTDTVSWVLGCRNTMEKREKRETTILTGRCLAKANTLFVSPCCVISVWMCVYQSISFVIWRSKKIWWFMLGRTNKNIKMTFKWHDSLPKMVSTHWTEPRCVPGKPFTLQLLDWNMRTDHEKNTSYEFVHGGFHNGLW